MMRTVVMLGVWAALVLWGAPAAVAKNIGDSLMVIVTDENGDPVVGGGGGGTATLEEQQIQTGHLSNIDTDTGNIASGVGTSTDTGCTAGSDGSLNCKLKNLTSLVDALTTAVDTLSAKFPSAAEMAEDAATPTISSIEVYPKVHDGTNWDFLRKADSGAGATGSATQRVVEAYDSGVCNPKDTAQFPISISASGNTELVALASGQTIYICDVVLSANGTVTATLIYGTGTNCGTGEASILPQDLTAQVGYTGSFGGRLKAAAANALCIDLSGAVAVKGVITYRKMASL